MSRKEIFLNEYYQNSHLLKTRQDNGFLRWVLGFRKDVKGSKGSPGKSVFISFELQILPGLAAADLNLLMSCCRNELVSLQPNTSRYSEKKEPSLD